MHDKCHHKVQLPILPTLKLGIVFCYKVRRLLYKTVRQVLLQIDGYYEVRRVSQSAREHSMNEMTFFSLENFTYILWPILEKFQIRQFCLMDLFCI